MNRSRLLSLLAAILILPIATRAWGSPPSASTSTAPTLVCAVESLAGVPDRADGQFTAVIRGLANNPIAGASVVLDLSGVPDVVVCSDQLDPDAFTDCATHIVRKFTDFNGQVTFTLLGSSTGMSDPPSTASAHIYANGVLIRDIAVATYDLDGSSGVGANDLSVWLADFSSGQPHPRSDYDGSGGVTANDLSQWLGVFSAGRSVESCRSACP